MNMGAWAVGYIDGEGCLGISSRKSGSGVKYHYPTLQIQVRADDEGAINKVIEVIGVRPYLTHRVASTRTWNTKPTIQVSWSSKEQLKSLLAFFTKYPLQSRKGEVYALWEEAVNCFLHEKDYQAREKRINEICLNIKELRIYKLQASREKANTHLLTSSKKYASF